MEVKHSSKTLVHRGTTRYYVPEDGNIPLYYYYYYYYHHHDHHHRRRRRRDDESFLFVSISSEGSC
jgi:hypothetical protein